MTEDELKAIEARVNAASPGPWVQRFPVFRCTMDHRQAAVGHGQGQCEYRFQEWSTDGSGEIYSDPGFELGQLQPPRQEDYIVAGSWDYDTGGIQYTRDSDFIAHAREDIPALIAEIRRLRAASVTWQSPSTR